MQTHKRLIARILSLVLTSSMVLTTLPLNVLASEEISGKTEIIQESDKEKGETGGGFASFNTVGTGGTEGETVGLVEESAGTGDVGTNKTDNDFNINTGDFEIKTADECSTTNPHKITGETETNNIYVETGTHFIELNGVSINPTGSTGGTALSIASKATVNLMLAPNSKNTLVAGFGAGITVPFGAKLNISGTGSLESTGALNGAGIGGGNDGLTKDAGTITIDSGTITATGGNGGAGIGGGKTGSGGNITIKGGTVIAKSTAGGAGIGSGFNSSSPYVNGGTITIEGGNITATGEAGGAGIGGGSSAPGGTFTIKGGTVSATGGENGAGIGGGYNKTGGTINISGGTVSSTGDIQEQELVVA